jgi:hypothetical protein
VRNTKAQGPNLLAIATAITVAGCGGVPQCNSPRLAPAPVVGTDYLAKTDYPGCSGGGRATTSLVAVYASGGTDSVRRPDAVIAGPHTGLCWPDAIVLGPKGELYVVNHAPQNFPRASRDERWASWVTVFDSAARGDAAPLRVLNLRTPGLTNPYSFGVDRAGYLYAGSGVERYLDSGSVAVFAPGADGNVAPLRLIVGPTTGLHWPLEVAIDRGGDVYVTNSKNTDRPTDTVRVFAAASSGDVAPCRVIAGERTGLQNPQGLAIDRKGELYVANAGYGRSSAALNAVTVYDAEAGGDVTPSRTLSGRQVFDGMAVPRRLALDRHDSLYVRSLFNLTVFAPGPAATSGPARSFHRNSPELFALDRHDTLYTLAGNWVLVYPPGYSGTGPPTRAIGGPRSGINGVSEMAVDGRGWLYLLVRDSSVVKVYPPGASGDVPPSRTIGGPRTGLTQPRDIALDRADRLYVTNGPRTGSGGAIRVYAPGARGEDQPVRVLMGPETRLAEARDMEFDSRGEMYVPTSYQQTPGMVAVFRSLADSNQPPIRTIVGPSTLLRLPTALAFGRDDALYALNVFGFSGACRGPVHANATVTAYTPGASGEAEPVRTIVLLQDGKTPRGKGSWRLPRNIAVDSSGALEVWYPDRGVVYAPDASGAVAPVRTILYSGVASGDPTAVAASPSGTVYQTIVPPAPMICL